MSANVLGPPRIGSLFTGYGGLDMAVQTVLGGTIAWHAEHEPPTPSNPRPTQAAARLLAHHHPDVPNLGDISLINWAAVEPVAVLAGGFPCQDLSPAGKGLGLRPGTRSGMWSHMAYAIAQLRPALVVIENVRGLLSADAACDLEPCPWCVGDDEGRPLRALGAVLGDLAELGYDARWIGLRAADVGAPHGRFRVFVVAWPVADTVAGGTRTGGRGDGPGQAAFVGAAADTVSGELQRRRVGGVLAGPTGSGAGEGPERERDRNAARDGGAAAQDADSAARGERRPAGPGEAEGGRARPDARGRGRDAAADPEGSGLEGRRGARGRRAGSADGAEPAADAEGQRRRRRGRATGPATGGGRRPDHQDGAATAAALCDGREGREERDLGPETGQSAPLGGDAAGRLLDWGAYEPAIRRWELILGRPAPAPTQTGQRGGQQLAPAFVEWMMGLPEGHVTAIPGLTRNEQLKLLGNGVVPQQAETALRLLLSDLTAGVAA